LRELTTPVKGESTQANNEDDEETEDSISEFSPFKESFRLVRRRFLLRSSHRDPLVKLK
jgi:hypothetical protein